MNESKTSYNNTIFLLVGILGLIVLASGVSSLFFYDEDIFITNMQSPFMQQVWERSFIIKQFFKIQHFFFNKNPAGYHIVSALLHILNSFIALQLFKKLVEYYEVYINNKSAGLFAFFIVFFVCAVHTEPLYYLLGQGIFVFSLCSQFCLIYFIKYLQGKTYAIFAAIIFFILALLCYEISWMLPLMLLCIVVFKCGFAIANGKKKLLATGLFFIVLLIWFYIKTTYISAALVTDYKNISLTSIDFVKASRNSVVLFLRNFVPPFASSAVFISISTALLLLIAVGLINTYKYNKKTFRFITLLVVLTILAFLPTSIFGIDSHDAESERYVYFSSQFALMMLILLLFINIRELRFQKIAVTTIVLFYGFILFNSINESRKAGTFSKMYLEELNRHTADKDVVYIINQPSQHKGALLLRALTRMPALHGGNYTVLNEYSHYLYGNTKTKFITISSKELKIPPAQLYTVLKSVDSARYFFSHELAVPSFTHFADGNFAIAALKNDTLFVFK